MNRLVTKAIIASIAAGEQIMKLYKNEVSIAYKSDESPLTLADQNAHVEIIQHLSSTGIPILSEEGKTLDYMSRKNWGRFWLIDPLDGTKEFIKKNGEFTVNIALIENGIPIWGVVYAPALNKIYWGGGNASYKKEDVHPNTTTDELFKSGIRIHAIKESIPYKVIGSRSHASKETESFITELKETHAELEFVSMGSSLKICLVAEGLAQVYPRFAPTMEWDTAAGHAIALGAGCKVTEPISGNELRYNKENLLNPWFIVSS